MQDPNPGPFWAWLQAWGEQLMHAASLALVGVLIGIGQLLHTKEPLTARLVIGRALSTGGLSTAAAMVLAWMPGLPWIAQAGIAAALASLGTSGLERMFARVLGGGGQP